MKRLALELKLSERRPRESAAAIARFFSERFTYSIFLKGTELSAHPIADFLTHSRAGHCEYFASATALLLRAAGIPARYAVGFSISEWSALEGAFIARERHAHAWTLFHDGESWHALDTTPASWGEIEAGRGSVFEPLKDFAAWLRLRIARWRWSKDQEGGALRWLAVPIAAVLFWLVTGRFKRGRAAATAAAGAAAGPGLDSEFYAIERELARAGYARRSWESVPEWLARVEAAPGAASLAPLARLHARHRFDPAGLSAAERESLRSGVRGWLAVNGRAVV